MSDSPNIRPEVDRSLSRPAEVPSGPDDGVNPNADLVDPNVDPHNPDRSGTPGRPADWPPDLFSLGKE